MGRPVLANDHPHQRKVLESGGAGLVTDLSPEVSLAPMTIQPSGRAAASRWPCVVPPWVAAHRTYSVPVALFASVYRQLLPTAPW
jgi:hypothetical protein